MEGGQQVRVLPTPFELTQFWSNINTVDALPSVVLVFTLRAEREKVMTHKQKFLYTLLGAGIMAVGMTINQVITPTIEAQNNGVFDKIFCRELEVVDAAGNRMIVLGSEAMGNAVVVMDKQGSPAVTLKHTREGNAVVVYDEGGAPAATLGSTSESNVVIVTDRRTGNPAVRLGATNGGGSLVAVAWWRYRIKQVNLP